MLSVPLILLHCISHTPTHTHIHIYAHVNTCWLWASSKRSAAKMEVSSGNYTPNKSVTHSFLHERRLHTVPLRPSILPSFLLFPNTADLSTHRPTHTCTPTRGLYNQIYWEVTLAENAQKHMHTQKRMLIADSWLLKWLKCETEIVGFGLTDSDTRLPPALRAATSDPTTGWRDCKEPGEGHCLL